MPEMLVVSFQDNDGEWCEALTVPSAFLHEHFDQRGWTDYQIEADSERVMATAPLRAMSGSRSWRLAWIDESEATRPTVQRPMRIAQLDRNNFNLRTDD
jgi:hypothetical protein